MVFSFLQSLIVGKRVDSEGDEAHVGECSCSLLTRSNRHFDLFAILLFGVLLSDYSLLHCRRGRILKQIGNFPGFGVI